MANELTEYPQSCESNKVLKSPKSPKSPKSKSLRSRQDRLSEASNQVKLLNQSCSTFGSFKDKLKEDGHFPLKPKALEIMQINLGYMCNLTCEHCHVDAGPDRKEIMCHEVLEQCLAAIEISGAKTVDLTGGAPEMHPEFCWFVSELSKRNVHCIVRSNLTILVSNKKYDKYPDFFKENGVEVIASLPCYTEQNTDKQRGDGVFSKSLEALKKLNNAGYGQEGSGLKLNLVYNPGGPFLPGDQMGLEIDYKRELLENFGITFNHLYTITNMPISRFLDYLLACGKYEEYMQKLVEAYNPNAASNVMCTNTLSVDWQGCLYDCDFNQMLDLKVADKTRNHIRDFDPIKLNSRSIVIGQHCFGCTAGAGSSCQGTTA